MFAGDQKNILYLLILHFTFFQACRQHTESSLLTINVPNKTDDPVLLSDLAIEEKKIQLETKEKALLGFITEFKIYQNRILLSDIGSISIFDMEGNLIQRLGKQGEGPGEYSRIGALEIDKNTENILVVSTNYKLLVYGSGFQLIEEKKIDYPINYLKFIDRVFWVVSEEFGIEVKEGFANQTNIYRMDDNFQIMDTIPFRRILFDQKRVGGYAFRHWLSDIEDGLYLYMPILTPENILRDTLYQIQGQKVVPAVKFQFERKQSLNENDYQTLLLCNIFNSSSYYILEYDQDWERYMFLYDKKMQKGYNLKGGLIDDEGDPVFLRPLDLKEDLFYYIKKKEFEDKSIEEANPIIGIVKLR